jgi:transcriptional regulator with XRE-family HTH domain
MITQVEIARMLKLDVSTVNKILNRKPGTKFRPETVDKVHSIARKFGFDFGRLKFNHRRQSDRRESNLPVRLTLKLHDGTLFDEGGSRLRDLSVSGARLTEIDLPKGVLPAKPFQMMIEMENFNVEAVPVRLISNGKLDIAVAFRNVDENTKKKLKKLLP